ncbi:MAG: superoxide dismutase family protein [Alphaproteobacteria bacterium]
MKKAALFAAVLFFAATPVMAEEAATIVAPTPAPVKADVKLLDNAGVETGTVKTTETKKGRLFSVDVKNLAPGWHGVHIHGTGDCSDHGDHFKKAGGHATGEGQKHGFLNDAGPHDGDLPNLWVAADGTGKAEFYSESAARTMMDQDGSALMVHAGPDDYTTDPSGNSGDRVACGVMTEKK